MTARPTTGLTGDAQTTADLLARLQRHYIKPGAPLPGGVFLAEVGQNGAWGASQRVDALYVGFTSASGRLLVGHEVKASRSDWLTELNKPGKADAWADQCHEWWLVTVPGVVHDGELPDGWGLMYPGTSTTRMKIVTPARRHPDRQPSWDTVRSVIARQDTLRADAIHEGKAKAQAAARADVEAEVARRLELISREPSADSALAIREENQQLLSAFGLSSRSYRNTYPLSGAGGRLTLDDLTADEIAETVAILRRAASLRHATRDLLSHYTLTNLPAMERALATLRAAQATVADEAGVELEAH